MRVLIACVGLALGLVGLNAYATAEIDESFLNDLNAAEAGQVFSGFIHFRGGTAAERGAIVESAGLAVGYDYGSFTPARFAVGEAPGFLALVDHPAVRYVEHDAPLEYFGETATWASRAAVTQEPVAGGPYRDADGNVLDGSGISIAIIDSGVDGMHPDFEGRVSHSFKFFCSTPGLISTATDQCFGEAVVGEPAELPFLDLGPGANTDIIGGHGTHVAGIAAGSGAASTGTYPVESATPNRTGTYTGVAPGANIVAYSIGEGLTVGAAVNAYAHLIENYDDITPRVRVTNNSYGTGGGRENPNGMLAAAFTALTERGVVIAFAAGNDGGDGTTIQTSPTCNSSTPGVICVASQDDRDTGDAGAGLSGFSSRGLLDDATTHPDIAATGSSYTSTCTQALQPSQAVCSTGAERNWQPRYGTISGTSMATPHVAGAVALILQARPNLTPAEVEDLLQDTARKNGFPNNYIEDPQNPGNTSHFGWGAGMLDVQAALDALGVDHDGSTVGGSGSIAITSPGTGETVPLNVPVVMTGTLDDGNGVASLPEPVHVIGGDLDSEIPGAADVTDVRIGLTASGIAVEMDVRDATDVGPTGIVTLSLDQFVDGFDAVSRVVLSADGIEPSTSTLTTATPSNLELSGNTVSFDVGFAELGDPPNGSIASNVFVLAFAGALVDVAPGTQPNVAATVDVQPMYGRPYTIVRPGQVVPPSVQVQVSVNNGTPQAAEVSGSSPAFDWSLPSINGLVAGENIATATLLLDGEAVATDTVTFMGESSGGGGNNNLPPVVDAALTADVRDDGLTVVLDAAGSEVCTGDDCTTEGLSYTFHFGDDTDPATAAPGETSVVHTYPAAGTWDAFVVVSHTSGNQDFATESVTTVVRVDLDDAGDQNRARLTAELLDGTTVPARVRFDATRTTKAEGFGICDYTFDFDDGNSVTTTQAVVDHVYTRGGSFEPSVVVSFSTDCADDTVAKETSQAKSAPVTVGTGSTPGTTTTRSAGGGSGGLGWLLMVPLALAGIRRRSQ